MSLQVCDYDVTKFKEISCTLAKSNKEINDTVNATLAPYGPIEGLIEVLNLQQCMLLDFKIDAVKFLPNLKDLNVTDSNITKLSSTHSGGTNGMYSKQDN